MEDSIQVLGKIITCMAMGFIRGKMGVDMRVIMRWIKNMGMVYIHGLMGEDMRVIG